MMLCTRLYVESTEALMGQVRGKGLLSLTNIVIFFGKKSIFVLTLVLAFSYHSAPSSIRSLPTKNNQSLGLRIIPND